MIRVAYPPLTPPAIVPKVLELRALTTVLGSALKCLNRLKKSTRNWKLVDSVNLMPLVAEKSSLMRPGIRKASVRGELPKAAGCAVKKAAVLNQCCGVR